MKPDRRRLEQLTRQAAKTPAPSTPIAAARLEKLQKEIELLTHKVRSADLERRALEKELLFTSEAIELLNAAISPVVERLKTLPKFLAPRLAGQPLKEIERTLFDAANEIIATGRAGVTRFKEKTGEGREL